MKAVSCFALSCLLSGCVDSHASGSDVDAAVADAALVDAAAPVDGYQIACIDPNELVTLCSASLPCAITCSVGDGGMTYVLGCGGASRAGSCGQVLDPGPNNAHASCACNP
jgi:hypothetical protein